MTVTQETRPTVASSVESSSCALPSSNPNPPPQTPAHLLNPAGLADFLECYARSSLRPLAPRPGLLDSRYHGLLVLATARCCPTHVFKGSSSECGALDGHRRLSVVLSPETDGPPGDYALTSSWRLHLSLPAPAALSLLLRHSDAPVPR